MVDARELRQKLEDLNRVVGTKLVDDYKRKVKLPRGWHLDFQLNSNKFVVVNHIQKEVTTIHFGSVSI